MPGAKAERVSRQMLFDARVFLSQKLLALEGVELAPDDPRPLNNLAQELSNEDEGFRRRVEGVYKRLQDGVARALRRGQEAGTVRSDIDPERIASFYLAASAGIMGAAKTSQDPELMRSLVLTSNEYLEGLRALPVH